MYLGILSKLKLCVNLMHITAMDILITVFAIRTDVKNSSSFFKIALNFEEIPFRWSFKFINAVSEPEKKAERTSRISKMTKSLINILYLYL